MERLLIDMVKRILAPVHTVLELPVALLVIAAWAIVAGAMLISLRVRRTWRRLELMPSEPVVLSAPDPPAGA
jgi:hypothetical protein